MPYFYADPVMDAERYWDDKAEQEERLPDCWFCENKITREALHFSIKGIEYWMCRECMADYTEDPRDDY